MKNYLITLANVVLVSLILAIVVSCNNSHNTESSGSGDKSGSKIIDTASNSENDTSKHFKGAPSSPLQNGYYSIDLKESKLEWFCVIHKGYTLFKNGTITVENGKIKNGTFKIIMDSINDTDIDYYLMRATLVNTLKSDMFFDVKKFPYSTFNITEVNDKGDNRYEIKGDLKIMSTVNPITFISTITTKNDTLFAKSERFSINRTKWGITIYSKNFPQTDDSFLFTDYVDFEITLVMHRQKAP